MHNNILANPQTIHFSSVFRSLNQRATIMDTVAFTQFINLTLHFLAASTLTLRMRLRSNWLLSEWIATVLRPVTLDTASHSRSAPNLQSTNTNTGGW